MEFLKQPNASEEICFSSLPESLEAFKALPQAAMASPFSSSPCITRCAAAAHSKPVMHSLW